MNDNIQNPVEMHGIRKPHRKITPLFGFIIIVIVFIWHIFINSFIQYFFREIGMPLIGLALTEIIMLLMAVLPVIIFKFEFKEIFPVKKPKIRQVIGSVILWIATYFIVVIIMLFISYFFADETTATTEVITGLYADTPFLFTLFAMAILPAICEEAMFRGLFQSSLKPIKHRWITLFIVGLVFAVFHLDMRMPSIVPLGIVFAYILSVTDNILYPVILHFLTNTISVAAGYFSSAFAETTGAAAETAVELTDAMILTSIGMSLIIGTVIPFLILCGGNLLKGRERKRSRIPLIISIIAAVAMLSSGIIITAGSYLMSNLPEIVSQYAAVLLPIR